MDLLQSANMETGMRVTAFVKVGDLIITRKGYAQYWLIVDLTYNNIVFYNFKKNSIVEVNCTQIEDWEIYWEIYRDGIRRLPKSQKTRKKRNK